MRHLGWVVAIAVAFLAIHVGTGTGGVRVSVGMPTTDAMDISGIMSKVDPNLPVMVIDNLV